MVFGGDFAGFDVLAFFPTDFAATDDFGEGAFDGELDGAAVVFAHPAGEFEDLVAEKGLFADDVADFLEVRECGVVGEADDVALGGSFAEGDGDA